MNINDSTFLKKSRHFFLFFFLLFYIKLTSNPKLSTKLFFPNAFEHVRTGLDSPPSTFLWTNPPLPPSPSPSIPPTIPFHHSAPPRRNERRPLTAPVHRCHAKRNNYQRRGYRRGTTTISRITTACRLKELSRRPPDVDD